MSKLSMPKFNTNPSNLKMPKTSNPIRNVFKKQVKESK